MVTFVGESDNVRTGCCSVANFVTTAPTAAVSGNTLLLVANMHQSCCGAPSAISTPTGWTLINFLRTYTTNTSAAIFICNNYVPGTTGLTFTVTRSANPTTITHTWAMAAYSSVNTTTQQDATAIEQTNASSVNLTSGSITTVTNNALIVNMCAYNGTGTITDAAGTTRRISRAAANGSVYIADQTLVTAGASGAITPTIVGAKVSRGFTVALRPAAGGTINANFFPFFGM